MLRNSLQQIRPLLARSFVTKQENPLTSKASSKKTNIPGNKVEPSKQGYQAPEYYKHNVYTFADYDLAMIKSRLPQPSNKTK